MLIWGAKDRAYPGGILPTAVVSVFGVEIMLTRVILFGGAIVLMLLLFWFIDRTRVGTATRAVAIDQDAARLMGIDVNSIVSLVFLIGPALGGAAGVMMGLYYGRISYEMGFSFGLKAFTAAILGGIGNIPGAMIGGILLGVIEALGAAYISMAWKDAIAFAVLILILIVRPTGLLGERVADKL
jgi:branched-chain amino acid transport system permease protein